MPRRRPHKAPRRATDGRSGRRLTELPDSPYRIAALWSPRTMEDLSAKIGEIGGSMHPETARKYAIGLTGKSQVQGLKLIAKALGIPFLAIFKGSEIVAANEQERDFLQWFRLIDDKEKPTVVRMLKAASSESSAIPAQ